MLEVSCGQQQDVAVVVVRQGRVLRYGCYRSHAGSSCSKLWRWWSDTVMRDEATHLREREKAMVR